MVAHEPSLENTVGPEVERSSRMRCILNQRNTIQSRSAECRLSRPALDWVTFRVLGRSVLQLANTLKRWPVRRALTVVFSALAILGLSGCSAAHYRKSADKEVYQIIQDVEQDLFGRTNLFSIDTTYSQREAKQIHPPEIIANRLESGARVLTLEDALDISVQNSRRYQTERERLYLTALTLTGERYEFRPQFFAGTTVSGERDAAGNRLARASTRIGMDQLLKTGGSIGVNIANDLLRYYTGDPRRSAISAISINLFQPLLRGAGRDIVAEALTQAERNVIYGVRSYSFFQDSFAVEIVTDYYRLLELKDVVRNRYANYLSRSNSTVRLEARVDREATLSVGQARQAELAARDAYINTVAAYENALDQFKIKLTVPLGVELQLDDSPLEALQERGLIPLDVAGEEAFRIALEHQFEILNSIDRFEDSKRKIKVAANRLKADLNLFADAALQSEPPTDFTKFDPDDIRAGVGFQLNLPLDRLRERNSYRATLINFESELRNLTLALDQLRDRIDRGLRTLEQRRQNYQIQQSALQLANERVESASEQIQAGRAEVRDLVEAQDAQIAAENAVTAALVDYQEERLRLLLDMGVLETSGNQFWLEKQWRSDEADSEREQAPNLVPPDQLFRLGF